MGRDSAIYGTLVDFRSIERVFRQIEGIYDPRLADSKAEVSAAFQRIQERCLAGRDSVFTAAVEPKRESALLGAIVLEELDFLVDCTGQRLVPRDPKYIISEIE